MILNSANKYVCNLEEFVNTTYRENFRIQAKNYTLKIFNSLRKDKKLVEYSLLIAQKFLKFYNKIYFASMFNDDYLKSEFWIVKPFTDNKKLNNAISSEIYSVLEEHPKCKIKYIPINVTTERSARGDSKVSLFSRLRVVGYKGIFWSFLNFISFIFIGNKFKIGIIRNNELVRDISYYLLWKKNIKLFYFKNFFKFANKDTKNKNDKLIAEIDKVINQFITSALSDVKSNNIRELMISLWNTEKNNIINIYEKTKISIENQLSIKKINLILLGYIDMVRGQALYNTCRKKNIPIISCQHGITREIIADPYLKSVDFETGFSDYFFCYSDMSKTVTENSNYSIKNKIKIIGLPSDYKNFNSAKNNSNKICYVSTILLSGGIPNLIIPESDNELIKWEFNLINNVFKNISKDISYKPYPAIRYGDEDINIKEVNEATNMSLVGTHLDFRYIVSNYGLLITSGATSTLGWCVHSEIPMIFINRQGSLVLKKRVINDFKKAFFVFDDTNKNWQENLKLFLEKNYIDIIALWKAKYNNRLKVVKKYFGDTDLNAGLNGANFINKLIKKNI